MIDLAFFGLSTMTRDGPPPLPEGSTAPSYLRRAPPPERGAFAVVVRFRAEAGDEEPFGRRLDGLDLLATMRSYLSCSALTTSVDPARYRRTGLPGD